jgi:Asp-tRNA(Asn)/Glu-tRNA(Gln) amidotransferase A subunit family amidase
MLSSPKLSTRRDVLKCVLIAPLATRLVADESSGYADLTLTAAAAAIRVGDISAVDYAGALIRQSEIWKGLNAFISVDFDALLEAAERADKQRAGKAVLGALHGVPLALKDNIATTGLPTTAGTGALRNFRPESNAVVAQALFDAGALLFGKNNMHELAAGITNNNGVYGAARNPYNLEMIPGGSSGGTGAAIAARIVPGGLGTDTGGSVRIPASLCGTVGLRPTTGRYSGTGLIPFASGTAIAGPMARTVSDVALLDSIITGAAEIAALRLRGLRIGVPRDFFYDDLDPDVARISDDMLQRLRDAGVALIDKPVAGLRDLLKVGRGGPAPGETVAAYRHFFQNSGVGVSVEQFIAGVADPNVRNRLSHQLLSQDSVSTVTGPTAQEVRGRYAEVLANYFSDHSLDAMITPPTPLAARPVTQDETTELNGRKVSTFRTYVRNSAVGSAAGIPGIVVPAGLTSDGLPVGIELDAPAGRDRRLLAIARAVEELAPVLPAPRQPA